MTATVLARPARGDRAALRAGYSTPAQRLVAGLLQAMAPELVAGYTVTLLDLAGQWHRARRADDRDEMVIVHRRLWSVARDAAQAQLWAVSRLYGGAW